MKKLIIAAAIVCAAAMSQAAAVVWSAAASSAEKGYNVYILTSLAGSYANASEVSAAAIGTGTAAGSRSVSAEGTASGENLTKSTSTLYAVVVTADGTKYATTSFNPTGYVFDDQAQPPETSPGTASFSITDLSYKNFETVPEPTSGLLLLFGVAGLALRRRRAYL